MSQYYIKTFSNNILVYVINSCCVVYLYIVWYEGIRYHITLLITHDSMTSVIVIWRNPLSYHIAYHTRLYDKRDCDMKESAIISHCWSHTTLWQAWLWYEGIRYHITLLITHDSMTSVIVIWRNPLSYHIADHTRLYDKRDDFDFPIVNFPYLSSNIPESPAYSVFVSQLVRYARVCSKYEDFLFRGSILVSKLLKRDILHGNSMVSSCLCKSWWLPHVGHEMLTLSWTHDFTRFGESTIHYIYIYIIYNWIWQF